MHKDTQKNDTQHNRTQHNETQKNYTQHNSTEHKETRHDYILYTGLMTISISSGECRYAERHDNKVSITDLSRHVQS